MTGNTSQDDRLVTSALAAAAATAARHAPSILNTQPWRWRVRPGRLELFADASRRLAATDPTGRSLMLSCGAVLHHSRVALAAQGWSSAVRRLPDPTTPQLLATLRAADRAPVTAQTRALLSAMRARHTDRRPVAEVPVPAAALRAILAAADGHALIHAVSAEQLVDLAVAVEHATLVQTHDRRVRDELAYWTGPEAPAGTGLPATVLPEHPAQTPVAGREFGHPGTLTIGGGHDRAAVYALLHGDNDRPEDWLRAGEALSMVWLRATELGVGVVPLSDVIEVDATRVILRHRLLAGLNYPYLVLRLGIPDNETDGPPHPPRLATDQVVDTEPSAPPVRPL
jgi:nitroreductase